MSRLEAHRLSNILHEAAHYLAQQRLLKDEGVLVILQQNATSGNTCSNFKVMDMVM